MQCLQHRQQAGVESCGPCHGNAGSLRYWRYKASLKVGLENRKVGGKSVDLARPQFLPVTWQKVASTFQGAAEPESPWIPECQSQLKARTRAVMKTGRLRENLGASLVAQWLIICLLMQGTRVRALVWEDPTCHGATRPVSHSYGACAAQQERPR